VLLAVELAGILGALLAIPVASMIQVIARDVWDHRSGRPKGEPTVGEERRPVAEEIGAGHAGRLRPAGSPAPAPAPVVDR